MDVNVSLCTQLVSCIENATRKKMLQIKATRDNEESQLILWLILKNKQRGVKNYELRIMNLAILIYPRLDSY